jgi:hypothetical protein
MGKSARAKGRTYQSPKKARTGANTVWYAASFILIAAGVLGVALSRSSSPSSIGPTISDHWHAALGVNDCGTWVPNWEWPPGNVSSSSAVGAGSPARAGSGGQIYAGLHSHGDGLIHMEPSGTEDEGKNATLGRYFQYGGWKLSATSINFVTVDQKNGNQCNGKPGVLRWAVDGKEMHGNPAKYKLNNGDAVELVFTTAGAKLPAKTAIPSFAALENILGQTNPTEPAPNVTLAPSATTAPGATTAPSATTAPGASASAPTTVGAATTSTP